ncbi:LamG-like jellyroll fold domain-containing protein [Gillisia sp. Q332]|uniref:LamG-like jellyroll fold domain-containing protein n=1 Tax=Gillisia xinjiangensis TaxID=3384765 RepID=UPI00391A99BC
MGKITPRVKAILVVITFLGFTNLILSENSIRLENFIEKKVFPKEITIVPAIETSLSEVAETESYKATNKFYEDGKADFAKPVITLASSNVSVCENTITASLNYTSTNEPNTYSINYHDPAFTDVTNATLYAGSIPLVFPQNLAPGTYTAVLAVSNSTHTSDLVNFTVTIKPYPIVNSIENQSVCRNNTIPTIQFSGNVDGAIYQWTNDNTAIGLAASGTGDILSFTATNNSSSIISSQITVTPSGNDCESVPTSFTITVYPEPTVTKPGNLIACNNASVSAINFTGSSVSGTTYKWVNNNLSIGLADSGTGNIPSFTATNTTAAPVTAQVTVTPVANNCEGTPQTFTITVNPTPVVNNTANIVACNNTSISEIAFGGSSVAGTTYKWTNSNSSIGIPTTGSGNIPAFTAINTSNSPVTSNITVTPVANNCEGTPQTFTITVNPTPAVTKPADIMVCDKGTVAATEFSGSSISGTSYNWVNDNLAIGLTGSGTGNIPSFIATNTTTAPITANITVIPVANNCEGTPQIFTITVNPTATVNKPENIVACKSEIISGITFSGSSVTGTTYKWINDNTSIGLAATGNGNILSFAATNTTNSPLTSNLKVTPVANGCEGTPQVFTITVNPETTVNSQDDIFACNEESLPTTVFSGSQVNGTVYNWTNNNTSIGLPASGTGDLPPFIATNNTNEILVAKITLTPEANGCAGVSTEFDIIIYPSIFISAPEITVTPVGCNGESDGVITIGQVYGGNGTYLFSIDAENFGSLKTFTGLAEGYHTIYIKDTQRCSFETEIYVGQPDALAMLDPGSTPTTCFGASDGTVTAGTVTGGNGDYLYSVDNTNYVTTTTFTGLPAGTHTIFVMDSQACSLQKTVTITEPDVLKGSLSKTDVNCFGASTGEIKITNPSGGSGQFQYRINEGLWQGTGNFSGLSAGNYKVSIRDKNNPTCIIVLSEAYQISQPAEALAATVTTTRTTVYGTATGSATANPTGGSPGYIYEWKKAGQTTQITKTATNLSAGIYELIVTDSKGCKLTSQVEVIDAIEAFILTRSTCEIEDNIDAIRTFYYSVEDGTAMGGVGPYTYSWDFGVDAINQFRSGIGEFWVDYSTIGNKIITLTVTDSTGATYITTQEQYIGKCYNPCGKSSNIEFDPNNIYIGYSNGTRMETTSPDYCNDNIPKYIFIQVDKSANIYNPYIELGFIISNDISEVSNHYYVNGCRSGDDIDEDQTVNQPFRVGGFIKLTLDPIIISCGDNLNIDTFYTTWTNVSKKECGANNNKFCFSTNEPVFVPTELRAEATPTPILCKGDLTGTITVKASGGFAPYSYKLTESSVSQSQNLFVNLAAGDYTIFVEDAAGKKTTTAATVLEPATSISGTVVATAPLCYGETGEATVTPTGGTPFTSGDKYQYLWNDANQQTTATATGLTAGNYTVTVIDANGCQILESITITEPQQLTQATAGPDQSFNCGFRSTILAANTPLTGEGTWTIISSNGGTIAEPNNPASAFTANAGLHTLRWTIAHADGSCANYDEVNITFEDACSTLDFDGVDDYVYFDNHYGLTTGSFTLEAWVKPNSLGGVKTILSKRNSQNLGEGGYDLIINNGAPTFRWGNSSVSTSSKLATDRWYHIAVIYKDSNVQLYVDGIRVGSGSATNPTSVDYPFLIGAMHKPGPQDKPQNLFNGWIEEVRIWNSAINEEQLRFLMNQRVVLNSAPLRGTVLPLDVPGTLAWTNLQGYYRMTGNTVSNGMTAAQSDNKVDGELRNIETTQQNTAPLPYTSNSAGTWSDDTIWLRPEVWDAPNSLGINGEPIDWNIARISHDIKSGGKNLTLLGLLSETGKLEMANPNEALDENNAGQGLFITHYLKLDGVIDLVGESQLVQTDINPKQTISSTLDEASSGYIKRDQQGTSNSFNYNYWSSPVSLQGAANNSTYTIKGVMKDGTNSANATHTDLSFGAWHEYADGPKSNPRKISNYWLYKFRGTANVYSEWKHIGSTGVLNAGEGYTMKGTSGTAAIEDRQNYVYKGKPNNGVINLTIASGQNYLLGNPYPSSIDINEFIMDNLKDVAGGRNTGNVFNGTVYFWNHFAGGNTHILLEYIGGYAARNLLGGVPAISNDSRVNANDEKGSKIPGRFIPVAQGFFINSSLETETAGSITVDGGMVVFRNSQRAFVRESKTNTGNSVFLRPEENTKEVEKTDTRAKIRLDFRSPMGYHRQILVGVDPNASDGFDLGYDAALNDNNLEDMFWMIDEKKYVIQGVSNFDPIQVFKLGVKIAEEGELLIKINQLENISEEVNIYLKDKTESTYHNLRESDFKLILEKGEITERFEIVFQKEKDSKPDPKPIEEPNPDFPETLPPGIIDVIFAENEHKLMVLNPFEMNIKKVEIYNMLGQKIESFTSNSSQKEMIVAVREHPAAIYVVKVYAVEGMVSKNILLMR